MSGTDSVVPYQDYFNILSDCYHAVDFLSGNTELHQRSSHEGSWRLWQLYKHAES